MKRSAVLTALCGAALIAAPLSLAGVAAAAPPEPLTGSVSVTTDGCREVTVNGELGTGYPSGARFELAVFVGPNDGGAVSDFFGIVEVAYDNPGSQTFMLDRDSYGGSAFVKVSQEAGPDTLFADKIIVVDTSCIGDYPADPAPTTTTPVPTPTPATTPAPTTTPPATTVAPTPTDTAPVPDPADDEDDFDQVGTPPAGGVDTGAR